ncbi:MAG: hypothetical protein IPK32_06780 [Verrucomicrobiaceae bacterium]|nr:hypothetical protein [Verrucomicrobiaceae bacterium]
MIIIVSGEGATDIGYCTDAAAICEPPEFQPGAMGAFIDALVSPIWGYSPLESTGIRFMRKAELGRRGREKRGMSLPGKKRGKDTSFFFKNAMTLATYALQVERSEKLPTMAVLFRDTDGTASTERGARRKKLDSMNLGFEAAGYPRGVPMLPKPKSEAWLLCALKKNPYQHCAELETISGNDNSPQSAKKQLAAALTAHEATLSDLNQMIFTEQLVPAKIDMPSFNEFRARLEEVARAMLTN